MHRLRLTLVSLCATLVAVPMPACAWLAGCCHATAQAQQPEQKSAPAAKHSCCSDSANAAKATQRQQTKAPCVGDCCRVNMVAPVVQKVVVDQPFATALVVLFTPWTASSPWRIASVETHHPPAHSLQSLHCLMRC